MMSTREKHPKIHRIALVDNDPRALDSLSAVIASKVPTAYVVWTATSGCEAIERCQDANGHVSLLILDMSMEGLQGPATCRRLRLMGQRMPILGATSFSINSYLAFVHHFEKGSLCFGRSAVYFINQYHIGKDGSVSEFKFRFLKIENRCSKNIRRH